MSIEMQSNMIVCFTASLVLLTEQTFEYNIEHFGTVFHNVDGNTRCNQIEDLQANETKANTKFKQSETPSLVAAMVDLFWG